MTSISKNVYIDKLDDMVNRYSNTCHSTIKIKPVDVNSSTYINFDKKNNKEGWKFNLSDHVSISKCKNIFAKGYAPIRSEEVLMIKKFKNTVPWTYILSDLIGKEIVGTSYEKELQQTNQKEFRIEKAIKRKGGKL